MNKDFIKDPFFPECPIRNVLARIGSKWALAVLYTLGGSETPLRFKDIEKANPDCSQKMLTQTLRGWRLTVSCAAQFIPRCRRV